VKHLQGKVLKELHQELIYLSPNNMPLYRPRQKFNVDDNIVIVSKTTSRIINFILQDMGASNISQKMLKNPPINENNNNNI
jgi:hypothetical protein